MDEITNDKSLAENNYKLEKSELHKKAAFNRALPQILATCAKNMLLLTYGMTLGIPAIAIPALRTSNQTINDNDFRTTDILKLNEDQISWFSSINLICVPLGCVISGAITQPFGRKRSMMALNVPFFLVWVLYYNASSVTALYVTLVICGLAGGIHEAPVITYVAEITEPHLRGMLGSTASTTVIVGSVSQLILGNFFHWRSVVLINMAFPIIAFIALYFVPESPHWLIGKGKIKEAEKSLCWLRGWVPPESVQQELSLLVKHIETAKKKNVPTFKNIIRRYTKRTFLLPFFVIAIIFLSGHFGGMMSLQTNAVYLFYSLGTPMSAYTATLILGVVEFAGAILCVVSVHWTGKRRLLVWTTAIAGICLLVLAVYSYCLLYMPDAVVSVNWIPIIFLNATAFLLHAAIRLLPWVLIGELYPNDIRSMATGGSAFCFYIFAFMANKSFSLMVRSMNLYGLFLLYAVSIISGSLFMHFFLPETEGRTLEEIQIHFANKHNILKTNIDQLSTLCDKDKNSDKNCHNENGTPLSELTNGDTVVV